MLIGGRVTTTLTEGEYEGASADVDTINSWPIWRVAIGRMTDFLEAESGSAAELAALTALLTYYVGEARPTWNLADQKGPIQPSVEGAYRVPVPMLLALYDLWVGTLPEPPKPTAADEVLAPGPVRDAVNEGLRRARKAMTR